MESGVLRDKIFCFSGNIQAAYKFSEEVCSYLNFDLGINFDTSNSFQKFTNMVRNMIGRGLVQKPKKSGRTLILDERTFLQLIVARKYLASGCSMDCLSEYLIEMSIEELYDRLFTAQLPDIELVTQRGGACSNALPSRKSDAVVESYSRKLYYNIKISSGVNLLVEQGKLSEEQLSEVTDYLKRLTSRVPSGR